MKGRDQCFNSTKYDTSQQSGRTSRRRRTCIHLLQLASPSWCASYLATSYYYYYLNDHYPHAKTKKTSEHPNVMNKAFINLMISSFRSGSLTQKSYYKFHQLSSCWLSIWWRQSRINWVHNARFARKMRGPDRWQWSSFSIGTHHRVWRSSSCRKTVAAVTCLRSDKWQAALPNGGRSKIYFSPWDCR